MPVRSREAFPKWFKIALLIIVGLLVVYTGWAVYLVGKYGTGGFAAGAGVAFWGFGIVILVTKLAVFLKVFFDQISDPEDQHYSKNIRR